MRQFISTKQLSSKVKTAAFVLMLSFISVTVNAQFDGGISDPYNAQVIGLAAPGGTLPLASGATVSVTCPNGNNAEVTASRKILNIVRLVLNEETTKLLSASFTATLPVKIEYGPNPSSLNEYTHTFELTYNPLDTARYNVKNYFSFEGAAFVRVTVMNNIAPVSSGGVNMSDIIYVENEMRVTRYYQLQSGITPLSFSAPVTVSNPVDVVPVAWAWPAASGRNATQLEWTWLENELEDDYYILNTTTVDIEKLFNDNSTRVDLPYNINEFNIPLYYDGTGKLYFRIRPVNFKSDGTRTDGQWTMPNGSVGTCSYAGHNNDLNWQVRTSFAEEGKLKSVMAYYDGTLRSRQTVTKDNVNQTIVTAETFYDYEGRPAIQVLPVPGISNVIRYQANLNLFNTQNLNQNPAELFDLNVNTATQSNFYAIPPMSSTLNNSGAAKYYSPANDELAVAPNENIPDAEGYPYSVTRYTPDATGRIMTQSGVGAAHKMGSGRETKYYYGSPGQEELDGLFGTEVGYKSHYFKTMTKDANGQISVSYTDMYGRTIATALAGDSTEGMFAINKNDQVNYPNQGGTDIITRNLIDGNTNIAKGNAIESVNTLLVPAPNSYTFKYKLIPESLDLNSCSNQPICYECLYDLEISISDESGELAPVVYTYKNLSMSGNVDEDCNTHNSLVAACDLCPPVIGNEITIVKALDPGSYVVRKTLTISESSLQKYKDLYLQQGKGICETEQQIIDDIYNVMVSESNCDAPATPDCERCMDELGDYVTFRANYLNSIDHTGTVSSELEATMQTAFSTQVQNCNRICNDASTSFMLPSKRQLMLADMMPYGGQYATEDPITTNNGVTMYNKYNIFSTTFNPGAQPYYKEPLNANKLPDYYRNSFGLIDEMIHPGGSGQTLLDATSKEQFTSQFVNSWANALLPYHPEYNRLLYAENTLAPANVYNWISSFLNTSTYAAASSAGYIMTSNATITDPFYTVASAQYKTDMTTWITSNYAGSNLGLWRIARGEVKCKGIVNTSQRQSCYNFIQTVPPFSDVTTDAEKNEMWTIFRNLYASARDSQVNNLIVSIHPLTDDAALIAQGYQLRFGTNSQTASQYGWTWYTPGAATPPGIPAGGLSASTATQAYTGRCQSYIELWKQALLQCPTLANLTAVTRDQILNEITAGMVAVCIKGSDGANPFGSSTVKPSTPQDGSPRSFEDVINQVYAFHNINPPKDYYCNPYVIEFPKPYGKNPKLANEAVSLIDTCNCSRFTQLKAEALAAGYNPDSLSSLNQYFNLQYRETLPQEIYDALQHCSELGSQLICHTEYVTIYHDCNQLNPCPASRSAGIDTTKKRQANKLLPKLKKTVLSESDSTSTELLNIPLCPDGYHWDFELQQCVPDDVPVLCATECPTEVCETINNTSYPLSTPQVMPEFLKCGFVPKVCLTCDNLVTLTNEFKTIFLPPYNAGPHFSSDNLTPGQIEQNILFSRFLNYRTGFHFSWMQYAQAAGAANCSTSGEVVNLVVPSRSGNTPAQYIASNSITFVPDFTTGASDIFGTLIQSNSGGGSQVVICADTKPLNDTTGIFIPEPPCRRIKMLATLLGQNIYQQRLLTIQVNFEKQYRDKCMAAKNIETFTVAYSSKEYHYTLYYYDMAGNLVKTVPPKGIRPNYSADFLACVKAARDNCRDNDNCTPQICSSIAALPIPEHNYFTQYRYNSLNLIVAQKSPDASTFTTWSRFWYDRLGRLAVSQNAQQAADDKYSYTIYDELGRITEVGQKPQTAVMMQSISQDDEDLREWITTLVNGGGLREQITYTGYDAPYGQSLSSPDGVFFGLGLNQRNMRNRVSFTYARNLENDPPPYYTGTFYTYDIHGNVDTLLQDYPGVAEMQGTNHSQKRMVYDYDLISGKVNQVSYQPDWFNSVLQSWIRPTDKFTQKYRYDAENRMAEVWTSRDNIEWERDAAYKYYKYGPLSRTLLGQLQVQGIDYAYTIHGWLKGVNGTMVSDGSFDIGKDGLISGPNSKVARDIYGFGLHYYDNGENGTAYEGDYKAIGGATLFARPNNAAFKSLYNGNIGGMSVNNAGLLKGPAATTNALPLFYNYRYDQLNRIKSMTAFKGLNASNEWVPVSLSANNDYGETVSYDPNGNILSYTRNATGTITPPVGFGGGVEMDKMTYEYHPHTNQLKRVTDNIGHDAWDNDIDAHLNTINYEYDHNGNLTLDRAEHIKIDWTVYGKISRIIKDLDDNENTTNDRTTTTYTYDAASNRITKTLAPPTGPAKITIYVRDAAGNVMSIYEKEGTDAIRQKELHIYGSARVGIVTERTALPLPQPLEGVFNPATISKLTRHEKIYELTNHLGNVLVTISDKKKAFDVGTPDGIVDHYEAVVVTAADYYPFGMLMPGRKYLAIGAAPYRYSINGQEKELELNENITTAEYWEFDSRIGRRWNVDPVPDESQSPYATFDNNPIAVTDPDGDCTTCPGDPIESKYLGWTGLDFGSFGNGIADGFIGALPELGEFVWDLIWSSDARDNFVAGLKTVFNDPIGTVKALAEDKYELWSSVLSGNGTEQQKYDAGKELGNLIFGVLSGSGLSKLTEVIKVAKYEKELVKIAQKADEATGAGKPTIVGTKIHTKFEKGVKAEGGNAEISYIDGKEVKRGTKESTRADAIYGKNKAKPKIAYDLKTGKSGISKSEAAAYKKNLPKGTKLKEISKDAKGKYKVKKTG